MRGIFVTGTDTGVGKTVVTGLLARYLSDGGYSVITQKWIETGSKGFSKDIDMHLKLMGKRRKDIKDFLPHVSPYVFKFASSPHLAAKLERERINKDKIKKSFRVLQKRHDFVIVEGVGGALVPYNEKRLVIDIAKELKLPVIVVAENRLGAINHTLLTIEAIKARKMKVVGVIFNDWRGKTDRKILKDNIRIIKKWIAGLKKI
ncbi:MAG: dethiobiotin synthase [Candidatus Omnitrophica bacterium]|nr:dethiobiotin synthase [Candidatus Omnitrophota bacterium]